MGAMRFMIVILAAVFAGIQGAPVEHLRAVKSIGDMYNETRKLLSHCTKILKSVCDHHSPMGCYESVTQMQNRLARISFNSCEETTVGRVEIHHTLHKLNIKKVLNEIKRLDVNSEATVESITETFASLSSHVTKAIGTLDQVSSKCSEILLPPNDTSTLNNIWIVMLVVVIFLVALKDCYMLISAAYTIWRDENTNTDCDPDALDSELVEINLSEPIGHTQTEPTG
ncbi:uncharacterized protein LOC129568198 [Sitodiplosis mosellana]|uniref:uncharacterized protein LOC129568198 n=1 Tax=Sitodiplosis mosellana TaxID=263140 RepID=UPI002444E286|nr:uncharacterized protein LOC129568198 [Sitodiplosis mosellana]